MIYTLVVSNGNYTTDADLANQKENIRIALDLAVGDVANNVFPEFTFGEVAG